jgi:hypothetical protein
MDSPYTTLGRPLAIPGFSGCQVQVGRRQRGADDASQKEPAIGDGYQVREDPQDMLIRARAVLRGSHTDWENSRY